jgi:hypothetical protein
MCPIKLKMQPTIHLEGEAGYLSRPYPALRSKCIVGCPFTSVGPIITRKSPCITSSKTLQTLLLINLPWQTMIRGKVHELQAARTSTLAFISRRTPPLQINLRIFFFLNKDLAIN